MTPAPVAALARPGMSVPTPDPRPAPAGAVVDERAQLALLTGEGAGDLLEAVLATEGVRLGSWSVHQVHHRPGVGVTVGYVVHWGVDGDPDGARGPGTGPGAQEYLLASTAPAAAGPDVLTVRVDEHEVRVWRHPADPALPALTLASTPERVAGLLGVPAGDLALDLVTYRPLRRAVLRARTPGATTYLKVVRPHTAAALHERHELLGAAGLPVATTTVLPDGLVLLTEVSGTPLTDALAADGAANVDPEQLVALLDRLPAAACDLPARPAWADRVLDHGSAAAAAVPDSADGIERLARDLAALIATTDPGPLVAAHGDLHDANLLMAGPRVVGMLDVDQLGPGRRVDDLACLLGHLSVLPALSPEVHRHVPAALPRWVGVLERGVDPVGLRARAGAVALSLVAGAGSPQDATGRLAAARTWFDDACRLRDLSSPRPAALIRPDESRGVPGRPRAAHLAAQGPRPDDAAPSRQQGERS